MNHLTQIAAQLDRYEIDAVVLTSKANRFYATGFPSSDGMALVTKKESYFLTDSRYTEAAKNTIQNATVQELPRGETYGEALARLVSRCGVQRLGFEEASMTVLEYQRLTKQVPCAFVPAQALLDGLRAAKGEEELRRMRKAQWIAERGLEDVLPQIKVGVSELDLAAELTYRMMRWGGAKNSFDPIVVSGPNSSLPHGVPTARKIQKGDFVTMDFGCIYEGYCSDMTRTVAVGSVSEEMRAVYQLVLRAQEAGIAAARAGVPGRDVDQAARGVIEQAGYGAYFGHGFGHSLGIEVHEGPNFNHSAVTPMPVGAVVSAEPGIYLPGRFGVRIEDVLCLHETGCENLSHAPKELRVLD
ncbi:MAG: M24 family metallopeptidase [Oscillospiraceae bacterium]|jgi:Xaa-Pro aminopeptidase